MKRGMNTEMSTLVSDDTHVWVQYFDPTVNCGMWLDLHYLPMVTAKRWVAINTFGRRIKPEPACRIVGPDYRFGNVEWVCRTHGDVVCLLDQPLGGAEVPRRAFRCPIADPRDSDPEGPMEFERRDMTNDTSIVAEKVYIIQHYSDMIWEGHPQWSVYDTDGELIFRTRESAQRLADELDQMDINIAYQKAMSAYMERRSKIGRNNKAIRALEDAGMNPRLLLEDGAIRDLPEEPDLPTLETWDRKYRVVEIEVK